jgi:5-formyltetrahydrofolate cyclo-ligase
MRKDELRRHIRQLKRQYSPQQLEEMSLPIIARLKSRLAEAKTILAYYSLPDEVNTHQLLDEWVAEGKKLFLPKVIDDETMVWVPYTGSQYLVEGAFHILEPEVTKELSPCYTSSCYILVPGVAFDSEGHRLGRGKGYYDRFLSTLTIPEQNHSHLSSLISIGICFDFQKVEEVPTDEYDIPVDEVI